MSRGGALLVGYGADLILGDPARWHPVAGFGRLSAALERRTWARSRLRGALVAATLVGLPSLLASLATRTPLRRRVAVALLSWITLGGRSLRREASSIAALLERDDLPAARRRLPALCGRDPDQLDQAGLARAVVESLAENTSDAVVGTLVWGVLAGPAGLVAYRAANTLDAMFGHRSERYAEFGWAAARLDDAMNWIPARVSAWLACALAPVVGGRPRAALATLRRDGGLHPSPNAGRVEAAFAGALGVQLGGPLTYGTALTERPRIGEGPPPEVSHIRGAARLSCSVGTGAVLLLAGADLARAPR